MFKLIQNNLLIFDNDIINNKHAFINRISMILLNVYFHVFIMHISHALDNHRGRSKERGREKREAEREKKKGHGLVF